MVAPRRGRGRHEVRGATGPHTGKKGREGGPSSGVNFQSCKNKMREERTAIFHSVVQETNKKREWSGTR